ncbi:MAG: dihydroorotate dehydrogenase electron transfer subunit [Rubrobacteraceae bacterium]|nr:dihydroorotate dehydrogenase electron transfer subunit [Rubrobacter sp.]
MKFHTVEVEGVEALGRYVLLRYPWSGAIEPGQFTMARAAGYPTTFDPFLARPFSFYDHDGETASLLFEVRGRGTQLLAGAKETIEVSRPLGKGFRVGEENGRSLLLGGGVGVAPFKFLSRRLDELGVEHDVVLGFVDEGVAGVAEDFPRAKVATMDGSLGVRGTVLDAVGDLSEYSAIYACGPNAMLAAVKKAANGIELCQLSVEERMGCGNGSCNGCVVPTKARGLVRSCIEGPVFDAEVLAW